MKPYRIPVLVFCLILFFLSLGWLSDVLISSEKKSAEAAWRARLDGIAAMFAVDMDAKMRGILDEETRKAHYEYVSPGVLEGKGIELVQGPFKFQKQDFIKGYALMDFEGNIQTPEANQNWISPYLTKKHRVKSIADKLNSVVEYENLTNIKKYDTRLAVHIMKGIKREPQKDGWAQLHSPDKKKTFVRDGDFLWALTQASNGKEMYAQGIAFDWEKLQSYLLEDKTALLPGIILKFGVQEKGFVLSSIPVSLVYGAEGYLPFSNEIGNYLKWSLVLIWTIALLSSTGLVWLVVAMTWLEKKRADFVSTVTHELRTPLTSILLHVEMLAEGIVPEEKKKTYYTTMAHECHRLERLIENILSYSRLQRGKNLERKDTLAVSEVFSPLVDRIGERLRQAGFTFSYAIARQASVQLLTTDVLSIEQIIDNLASNAIKYAESSSPEIILTVQLSPRELIVRFRDNGPGIPKKLKNQVFEPFSRLQRGKPGVGLGLALSRDMARFLGGELVLESGGLNGACFKLTLPLGPAC